MRRSVFVLIGLWLIAGCGVSQSDSGPDDDNGAGNGEAQVCAGIQGLPCDAGEYCNLGVGHCCCDFQGSCEEIPSMCIEIFSPVCGCDGTTYGNSCKAAAAGVSIDFDGECNRE